MQLIPLESWAAQRYPEKTPHIQTLRRWTREGRIQPPPQKHGRSYYVQPEAQYLSDSMLVAKLYVAAQTQQ